MGHDLKLRVVRPSGYPSRFNTPRNSNLQIRTRHWLPLHKLWKPAEAVLLMASSKSELIHTFNRIPVGNSRFVITFESHLPRLYDYPDGRLNDFFIRRLVSDKCFGIIPISEAARRTFLHQHRNHPLLAELKAKLLPTIYPAVPVPSAIPYERKVASAFKVVFVGSHFVRKGGLAVLRAAELASEAKIPIEFHIVSDLTMGRDAGVWTDPKDIGSISSELASLKSPNVVQHGRLANNQVLDLLRSAHVAALPTISDTFGYSVLEAFSLSLPVIATDCYALPEIITDGIDGRFLPMERDELGQWKHLFAYDELSEVEYVRLLRDAEREKGNRLFEILVEMEGDSELMARLTRGAYETVSNRFNAATQAATLEDLYQLAAT